MFETVRLLTDGVVDGYRNDSYSVPNEDSQQQNMKQAMFKKASNVLRGDLTRDMDETDTEISLSSDDADANVLSDKHGRDSFTVTDRQNKMQRGTFDWPSFRLLLHAAWKATRHRKGWDKFSRVFMTNASINEGVKPILVSKHV